MSKRFAHFPLYCNFRLRMYLRKVCKLLLLLLPLASQKLTAKSFNSHLQNYERRRYHAAFEAIRSIPIANEVDKAVDAKRIESMLRTIINSLAAPSTKEIQAQSSHGTDLGMILKLYTAQTSKERMNIHRALTVKCCRRFSFFFLLDCTTSQRTKISMTLDVLPLSDPAPY